MNTHFYSRHKGLAVLLAIAALFVLDLIVSVAGTAVSLSQVRSAAAEKEDLGSRLDEVSRWGGRGSWFAGHPAYRLAGLAVPDLVVASELSRLAADAGSSGAAALHALGGGDAPSVYSDGRVDLARVAEARAHLSSAIEAIDDGLAGVDEAGKPLLGRTFVIAVDAARRLREARVTATALEELLASLPRMLGGEGVREYLLAFQSPSEARGGGGLIGVTAVLSADGGRLDLDRIRTVRDLVARMEGRVAAPPWFQRTYGPLLATREWRTANVSPNFPVTSQVLLRMYERSTGESADGVIAMDPLALAELTDAVGPLRADGWNVTITKDNARRVLLHDVYRHFHFVEHRQNRYFAELLDTVWNSIGSGDAEPDALAASLADSVGKQHLKVFVDDQEGQDALERLGASGSYTQDAPVQMVFNNNWSANKIDFFLHRRQRVSIHVQADGSARVTTEVLLGNRIEDLEQNVIARPGVQRELPLGLNRMLLTLLMPEGAERPRLFVKGRATSPIRGRDGEHPTVSQFVDVPAGEEVQVTFSYVWPEAVTDGILELTIHPQATARPDRLVLEVIDADGTTRTRPEQTLKVPLEVSFRLR